MFITGFKEQTALSNQWVWWI